MATERADGLVKRAGEFSPTSTVVRLAVPAGVATAILGFTPAEHAAAVLTHLLTPAVVDGGAVGVGVSGAAIGVLTMARANDNTSGRVIGCATSFASVVVAAEGIGAAAHDPFDATMAGLVAGMLLTTAGAMVVNEWAPSREATTNALRRVRFPSLALGVGAAAALVIGRTTGIHVADPALIAGAATAGLVGAATPSVVFRRDPQAHRRARPQLTE